MKHGSWSLQLLLLVTWGHFAAAASQPIPPLPTGFDFFDECDRDFSLRAELGVDGAWPESGTAWIVFHWQAEGSGYAAVLEADQARFFKVEGGSLRPLGAATHLYYKIPYQPLGGPVTLQRHGDRMALIVSNHVVARAADADFRAGRIGLWTAPGLTWREPNYQPMEDLYFLDDYIRWGEEGEWQVVQGSGEVNHPYTQPLVVRHDSAVRRDATIVADYKPDVFTCHLRPAADGPALALAGYWFHCDYLVEAVVKPLGEGAIGLCLYAQDADNYLLFEWTSGPQGYARVRCIQDGREDYPESWNQLTASPEGGYEPGEWYRLAFQADADCLRAFINGRLVLKVHSVSFGQGRWGLYAAGCEAVFDDVRAESGGEPMGRKSEEQTVRDVWQYGLPAPLRRPGMLEWGWQGQPSHATWYQGALYRDPLLWLSFRSVPPLLRATIGADTEEFGRGYDLEVRPGPRPRLRLRRAAGQTVQTSPASPSQEEEPGAVYQVRWRLLRRGQEVAAGQGTWLAERGYPYLLRFDQVGSQVCASFGRFGRWRVFTWNDPRPLHGRRAGYWSSAEVVDQWGSQAWSPHLLEYRWLQAPVDWRMESGTWVVEAPSGRGFDPCDPVLVFHGSASDEAALWHKLHFADDLVVEVFASGKHDLNVTLCGDGADVRSGYSFIFAGWDRTRSATLKQGKVVADAPFEDPTTAQDPGTMTPWYYLRVEKQGRRLCFAANHQPLCEYTDPQPLAGGKVALWTQQGDLVLYRVRVWYEGVAGKG